MNFTYWKVLHTDNFGGDYPNEKFVTELPIMNQQHAEAVAAAINAGLPEDHSRFYKAVKSDHALAPGFEP